MPAIHRIASFNNTAGDMRSTSAQIRELCFNYARKTIKTDQPMKSASQFHPHDFPHLLVLYFSGNRPVFRVYLAKFWILFINFIPLFHSACLFSVFRSKENPPFHESARLPGPSPSLPGFSALSRRSLELRGHICAASAAIPTVLRPFRALIAPIESWRPDPSRQRPSRGVSRAAYGAPRV